jgi:hypothetical protein
MGKAAGPKPAGVLRPSRASLRAGLRTLATHGVLVLATILAIVYRGYHFGKEDQNLYFPFILHWNNPSLFAKDPLMSLNYARQSLTWLFLSAFSKWMSLEVLCLLLYVACSYLVLLLTFKTALLWWRDERAAWLAVALWIPTYEVPGVCNNTFDDYFTTRILGTVVGMALIYVGLKSRARAAGVLSFLGGVAHIISGIPVMAGVLLASSIRKAWGMLVWVGGGFLIAVAVVMHLGGGRGSGPNIFERYGGAWLDTVLWADHELFPHLWPAPIWHTLATYISLLFCLFLWRRWRGIGKKLEQGVLWICSGIVLCSLVGWVGSALHLVLIIQLCLFRGYLFLMWLLALYLSGVLAPLLWERRWLLALSGSWLIGCWISSRLDLSVIAIPAIVLELNSNQVKRWMAHFAPTNWPRKVKIYGAAALLALIFFADDILFYGFGLNVSEWFQARSKYYLLLALVCLFAIAKFTGLLQRSRWVPITIVGLVGGSLLVAPSPSMGELMGTSRTLRMLYGPRCAKAFVAGAARRRAQSEREPFFELVRDNVPQGCSVLVPPDWMDFRLRSHRSPYVTFKDGAPAEFNQGYALDWMRRIKRIHGVKYDAGNAFLDPTLDLSQEEVEALSKEERGISLNYLATSKEYSFPLIGQVGKQRLYCIAEAEGYPRSLSPAPVEGDK